MQPLYKCCCDNHSYGQFYFPLRALTKIYCLTRYMRLDHPQRMWGHGTNHFLRKLLQTAKCARVALGCGLLLGAAGCASNSYMGISLEPGQGDLALQELARAARAGDKQAQLDLGIRFETGDRVVQNYSRAISLYGRSARSSNGVLWVYLPPVGNGTVGRVLPIAQSAPQVGNLIAQDRLTNLRSRR